MLPVTRNAGQRNVSRLSNRMGRDHDTRFQPLERDRHRVHSIGPIYPINCRPFHRWYPGAIRDARRCAGNVDQPGTRRNRRTCGATIACPSRSTRQAILISALLVVLFPKLAHAEKKRSADDSSACTLRALSGTNDTDRSRNIKRQRSQ